MSLSNYPIHYFGNKYQETKKYLLDFDYFKFNYVCEPYGGIYGFSRAIFNMCNNECFFLINDLNNDLILLHNYFKNHTVEYLLKDVKDAYTKYNIENLTDTEIKNLKYNKEFGNYEPFLFLVANNISGPRLHVKRGIKIRFNNVEKMEIYKEFFNRCVFFNMEAKAFIDLVIFTHGDKNILFFFDPPYFDSNNKTYINANDNVMTDTRIIVNDNTNMYIDIIKMLKSCGDNIGVLMIINKNSLIDYVYNDYIISSYKKTYAMTINKKKRETYHNIIGKNINKI